MDYGIEHVLPNLALNVLVSGGHMSWCFEFLATTLYTHIRSYTHQPTSKEKATAHTALSVQASTFLQPHRLILSDLREGRQGRQPEKI